MGLVSMARFSRSRNTMVKTAFRNSNPKCCKSPLREIGKTFKDHKSGSKSDRDSILVCIPRFFGTPNKMAQSVLLYLHSLCVFESMRNYGLASLQLKGAPPQGLWISIKLHIIILYIKPHR